MSEPRQPYRPFTLAECQTATASLADYMDRVRAAFKDQEEELREAKHLCRACHYLRGRRVVVIPDNDEPGRQHAERAAGSLLVHGAASVRVVELPGLAEKGDVSDWLTTHTGADLVDLICRRPEFRLVRLAGQEGRS